MAEVAKKRHDSNGDGVCSPSSPSVNELSVIFVVVVELMML